MNVSSGVIALIGVLYADNAKQINHQADSGGDCKSESECESDYERGVLMSINIHVRPVSSNR